jgi:hypothetical protein
MATTNNPNLHPALAAAYAETLAAGVDVEALQTELARYGSPRPAHGPAESGRTRLVVAVSRSESEPCEAGTVGCCVAHAATDHGCEGW